MPGHVRVFLTFIFVLAWQSTHAIEPPLGEHPNFHHLMRGVGDTVGEVLSIAQDKAGYVWVGGRNGVARYDGYRFHHYRNNPDDPNSLSNNVVRDLYEDSYGELWFATESGGVMRFNRSQNNFHIYRPEASNTKSLSSLIIWKIYEDSQNNLWIAGRDGLSLYNRDKNNFTRYLTDTAIADFPIVDIKEYQPGKYIIATELGGLFVWDKNINILDRYVVNPSDPTALPHMLVRSIHIDKKGRVWVGSELGLSLFDVQAGTFTTIDISRFKLDRLTLPVLEIYEDSNGVFWLCTDGGGLLYFEPDTREMGQYLHSSISDSALISPYPRTVYEDVNGDLWIGSFPKGINFFDKSNTFFNTYRNFAKDAAGAFSNDVWSFFEEENGDIWLGVDNAGLLYFDRKKNTISREYNGFKLDGSYSTAAVLTIHKDSRGFLWVGTWGKGLYRINLKNNEVRNYYPEGNNFKSISFENIWSIKEDSYGNLWIATNGGGVNRYNYEDDTFTRYLPAANDPHSIQNTHVWSIYVDKKNRVWFGTLSGADVYIPQIDGFRHYRYDPDDENGLSHNWVTGFLEDTKGRMWLATAGGGVNLLNWDRQSFTHIRSADGLADDAVYGVLEDELGSLWFSTRGGLTYYNPETQSYKTYTSKNWLQDEQFHIGSYHKLKSGELLFGGVNGFTLFDPKEIARNSYAAPVQLTELKIFGETVAPGNGRVKIDKDISVLENLTLNYDQNMISLTFSSLNYRVYSENTYLYRLKGFDDEWIGPTTNNNVTYTNLNAGSYEFQVRSFNNDGVRSENIRSLKVNILPVPWKSWWAYSLYSISVLSVFLFIIYFQRRKIAYEHKINERLQEVDQLKDEFLANTSHELRTPLNGIIGMAEALISGSRGGLSQSVQEDLGVIVSSGRRLSVLVNDILDFSKVKHKELTLDRKRVELASLVKNVVAQCNPLLTDDIEIINRVRKSIPDVYADENRLQQIFHNLLGNAIKFTDHGKVVISAIKQETHVLISVADTGVGMDEHELKIIFESFEQLENSEGRVKNGTGLGLAVTKKLVELHEGSIYVESEKGLGSTFSFSLPMLEDSAHQFEEDLLVSREVYELEVGGQDGKQNVVHIDTNTKEIALTKSEPSGDKKDNTVLVVDDENVNRQVLRFFLLKEGYTVYEAKNGEEALAAFRDGFVPDIVLLDVMMPKISGFEVCKELRNHHSIYELPIIFISAKSQESDINQGYEVGGTDFLLKPVNKDELNSKVARHIQYSIKIKELVAKSVLNT